MVLGRSIRIYLADGSTSGIRHAEIVNWTGQAIAVPRVRITELSTWQEAARPGVYFLFGKNEEDSSAVYIGEAESVVERLKNHVAEKDFWNEVILFTSKDDNLTKAHVKYLESRLLEIAKQADRYSIQNSASPGLPILPRGECDAMEEFAQNIVVLLGTLGHKVLEPVAKSPSLDIDQSSRAQSSGNCIQHTLNLITKGLKANAVVTDEGIVVLKGSQAVIEVQSSLSDGYVALRQELISQRIMLLEEDSYLFMKDYLFASPSQAAAIVVGSAVNGRVKWQDDSGKTLKQLEAAELELSALDLAQPFVGILDDAPDDLATNPEYMSGFGL